ncbi:MAG: substrate-binding domain-containing protein [Prevotella sp.]|jgi:phosphate transport system substrate-binding protein|nr:substrate-binding domain-containing protein [Prevotella sp.]
MKRLFNVTVGLTLIIGLLSACSDSKPKYNRTDTYNSGTISFASDESFSPIIDQEVLIFMTERPKATLIPIYTTELDAINMLLSDSICLAITAKDLTPKQKEALKAKHPTAATFPIAYDGLALIVNASNPDTCITVNDIKRLLTGQITKWNEVYPNSKLGDFKVVFDNKNSSTVRWCEDSILGGKPITNPNVTAVEKSAEVIDFVEKHANAIGIIGSNWLKNKRDSTNATFKKEIKVVAVSKDSVATKANSFQPYQYYLYTGQYPLIRTLYVLMADPLRGLPWGFSNFLVSPKGQLLIFRSSILPYRADLTVKEVIVN